MKIVQSTIFSEMDAEGLKEIAQLLNGLSSQDFTDLAESVLGYTKVLPQQSFA